jgi:heme/copper-type cytochrome/quinol oxidase subunit 1
MLSAKLFATLAIMQVALVALFRSKTPSESIDVFFHATYFVIGRIHLMGLTALASACFALIYFAASRWVLRPLNNSLGITHFVLALAGYILLFVAVYSIRAMTASGEPMGRAVIPWRVFAFLVGVFCFLLGCVTLAVNCVWTTIAAFRSR